MGYLAFLVISPFLASLAWAAIFAMTFYRMHLRLCVRMGPNAAALVITLVTAVLIVAPAVLLVSVLAREVPQIYEYVHSNRRRCRCRTRSIRWEMVRRRSPMALPQDPAELLREGMQRSLAFLAPRAGGVVADALSTLGSLFVMLFALFFMLRDYRVARAADTQPPAASGARAGTPDYGNPRSHHCQRRGRPSGRGRAGRHRRRDVLAARDQRAGRLGRGDGDLRADSAGGIGDRVGADRVVPAALWGNRARA